MIIGFPFWRPVAAGELTIGSPSRSVYANDRSCCDQRPTRELPRRVTDAGLPVHPARLRTIISARNRALSQSPPSPTTRFIQATRALKFRGHFVALSAFEPAQSNILSPRNLPFNKRRGKLLKGCPGCFQGIRRRRRRFGKRSSRNCTRRSGSCWWNGIFWRGPPVDEPGPEAVADRSGAAGFVAGAAVQAAVGEPLGVVLPTTRRDGAEFGPDAADRRTVPGDAVVWQPADGAASSPSGS